MDSIEHELKMVQGHVDQGRAIVERQRIVIVDLMAAGHPTASATELLATLEHTQQLHEAHLARLTTKYSKP